MIRRALVALDGSPKAEAAVTLAIDWARRFDAGLVGLGVLDEPSITKPEAVSLGATGFKRERDELRLADAHQRVLAFLAKFDARCRVEGVRCVVLEDVGRPDEQIVREAQGCDVVILGREENFHFETDERDAETLGRVLRNSPRPVVVVPEAPASGAGVLVAYGGGREVARTLQSFTLLGLADGEVLDVVAIHPDREEAERRLRPAGEYLTAHGLPHRLRSIASDASAAEVILDEVHRLAPRLVVMGAHAHHPLRELFVTSVTRAVLSATPVPVFVGA